MAKISARGCHKVASAHRAWTDDAGYDHKRRLALRSDGAVLRAHDLRSASMRENYGPRGWQRGGYSIVGYLRSGIIAERFARYAEHRGYTLD